MRNLFINNRQRDMYGTIKESLKSCKEFIFIVSFIRYSGVQIILDILKEAEVRGIKGRILTTNYMDITEKKALERLKQFSNLEIKFFNGEERGFHPKGYIFLYEKETKVIIGSSNISQGGLRGNVEWSSETFFSNDDESREEILEEFNFYWNSSKDYDEKYFIDSKYLNYRSGGREKTEIKPNYMQEIGLENLQRIRKNGEKRGLGIAATGTGKTYLAAFDVAREKPEKILYLVHREEILNSALKTFKSIIVGKTFGKYTGIKKEREGNYIFATIQSIYKNLESFKKEEFQYIVIDEAHHSTGITYQKILNYFEPKFLLGLTATPERGDGKDIFNIFHGNVVMEIRMREALKEKLIAPFHYFGISDIKEIDLENLENLKIEEIAKKLMVHRRTEHILKKIQYYGYSGNKMKAIGFCVDINHAKYMAEEFRKKGIEAVDLTGENSVEDRERKIQELKNENSPLKTIFTVDIFNEGIDIPDINLILMLRPTESPVIFLQQLGRGLRKIKEKEFLTVLDFIGNHKKNFLIPMAFMENSSYDKDSIKIALKNSFKGFPSEVFISMDKVSEENIFAQIENENFNSLKYLKEEYLSFKYFLKRVPQYLDFFYYEGAPNILKFILKFKSYYTFLKVMKEEYEFQSKESKSSFTEEQIKILEQIENFIPIKRVNEYAIINYLLKNERIDKKEAKREVLKYIEEVREESIEHTFDYLDGKYLDAGERKREIKLFEKRENHLEKSLIFCKHLENEKIKEYIREVLAYGILDYEKKFGNQNYGVPFLRKFEKYSMKNVALLSNYKKLHSSYRNGINISEDKKNYYLFMTLNKDKEGFENTILDRKHFYWYTKESTGRESETGKNFLESKNRGIQLHFFMRKFSKIDNITEEFTYLGLGEIIDSYEEKPIKCKVRLEHPIKEEIYLDFIEKI